MRKGLILLTIAALCIVLAFHYLPPDFFSIADASNNDNRGAIADLDQPLPQAVLAQQRLCGSIHVQGSGRSSRLLEPLGARACVDEVPTLIRLQQEFSGKGFTVLAIAVDDQGEESVESFVANKRFSVNGASASINYPVLRASDETARKLGFEGGLPAGVLVNRSGREVKVIRGVVSFPKPSSVSSETSSHLLVS